MLNSSAIWSADAVVGGQGHNISLTYAAACAKHRMHLWVEAICRVLVAWAGFAFTVLVAGCVDWTRLFQLCSNEKCGAMSDFVRRMQPRTSAWDAYVVAYAVIVGIYLLWSSFSTLVRAKQLVERRKEIEERFPDATSDAQSIKSLVCAFHSTTPAEALTVLVRHDARLAKLERRGILRQACACFDLRATSVLEYAVHFTIVALVESSNDGVEASILPHHAPRSSATTTLRLTERCRQRMCILAAVWLLALPIILPFVLVHAMLRNAEMARGGSFSTRCWAPRAKRCLRKPSEWPHETIHRLHTLSKAASQAVSHPGEIWMRVSGVLAFVVAAVLSVLAFMALVEEDALLHLNIMSRPLVWWGLVLPLFFRWLWEGSHPKHQPMDADSLVSLLTRLGVADKRELRALLPQRAHLYARDVLVVVFMPFILVCGLRSRAQTLVETALGTTDLIVPPQTVAAAAVHLTRAPPKTGAGTRTRSGSSPAASYRALSPTEHMTEDDRQFAEIDAILRGE